MKSALRRGLEIAGMRQGANPREWLGSLDAIPVEALLVQRLVGGEWA
jgi:hypothetical protein